MRYRYIYKFDSASQKTNTIYNEEYSLYGKKTLIKLKTPLIDIIKGKSFYYVLEDDVIIDCNSYIEKDV